MKIAEGLARRRDLTNAFQREFAERAVESLTYEEGSEKDEAAANKVFTDLTNALREIQSISVRINIANNSNIIQWDGADISLMQAIAARDNLARKIAVMRQLIDNLETAVGAGKRGYYNRRQKDEVRTLLVKPLSEIRRQLDSDQGQLRRLDMEIQKANWSLDLPD